MNLRRLVAPVLIGLGLVAFGLSGCEQRINTTNTTPIPPYVVVPADHIVINVVWPSSPASAKITVAQGGFVTADTTFTNPSGVTTLTVSGLRVGTYTVSVSAQGFIAQSAFLTIVDASVPTATLAMTAIAITPEINFVEEVITPNVPQTIPIEVPEAVQDANPDVPPAEVTITTDVVGSVTVVTATQSDVPPVVDGGNVTSSVVSAIQIQIPEDDPDAVVAVTLPLPLDSTEFASAAGGEVDIISFDFATSTWNTIGTATIGSGGQVTTSVTGLSTDNIVAVGVPPAIEQQEQIGQVQETYSQAEIDEALVGGQTELEIAVNPEVSFTIGKLGRSFESGGTVFAKSAVRDAPPGVPINYWAQAVPFIANREPALYDWLYNDLLTNAVDIQGTGSRQVDVTRRTLSFSFTYNYGGVAKVFSMEIIFSKGEVIIIHTSGTATGG